MEAGLALGLAEALAEWDIVSYSDAAKYGTDDVRPLYFGPNEPANTPDERVLLTVRPSAIVRGQIAATSVGINWRGGVGADPLDGLNFTGLLFRRLHRLSHYQFGAVRVGAVLFNSAGNIGSDASRRPGATANYTFRGLLPSVNR